MQYIVERQSKYNTQQNGFTQIRYGDGFTPKTKMNPFKSIFGLPNRLYVQWSDMNTFKPIILLNTKTHFRPPNDRQQITIFSFKANFTASHTKTRMDELSGVLSNNKFLISFQEKLDSFHQMHQSQLQLQNGNSVPGSAVLDKTLSKTGASLLN